MPEPPGEEALGLGRRLLEAAPTEVELWPPRLSVPLRGPDGRYVVRFFAGSWWALYYGDPGILRGQFTVVDHPAPTVQQSLDEAMEYIQGAPGGGTGVVARQYQALWRRVEMAAPRTVGPRRAWSELSSATLRGYRGVLRSRYGVGAKGWNGRRYRTRRQAERAEAEFARFYASATDLSALRRHERAGGALVNRGQFRLSRASSGRATFVSTWRVRTSSKRGRRG